MDGVLSRLQNLLPGWLGRILGIISSPLSPPSPPPTETWTNLPLLESEFFFQLNRILYFSFGVARSCLTAQKQREGLLAFWLYGFGPISSYALQHFYFLIILWGVFSSFQHDLMEIFIFLRFSLAWPDPELLLLLFSFFFLFARCCLYFVLINWFRALDRACLFFDLILDCADHPMRLQVSCGGWFAVIL